MAWSVCFRCFFQVLHVGAGWHGRQAAGRALGCTSVQQDLLAAARHAAARASGRLRPGPKPLRQAIQTGATPPKPEAGGLGQARKREAAELASVMFPGPVGFPPAGLDQQQQAHPGTHQAVGGWILYFEGRKLSPGTARELGGTPGTSRSDPAPTPHSLPIGFDPVAWRAGPPSVSGGHAGRYGPRRHRGIL